MRGSLLALMLILVSVSGCATEDESAEPAAAEAPQDEPAPGSADVPDETAPPSEAGEVTEIDEPGVGAISLAIDNVSGDAPLTVMFNLTAEAEESATWRLDFGDGASDEGELDAAAWSVNHTYAAGEFVAHFNVTYSAGNASRAVEIAVAAVEEVVEVASGTDMGSLTFTFDGTITLGSEIPLVQGCGVDDNSQNDHEISVPLEIDGVPVRVTHALMDMNFGASNGDSDIWVYDAAGGLVGESTEWNYAPVLGSGSQTEHFEASGNWPPGTWLAHVGSCVAVMGSYDVTLTLGFVAA